MHFSTFLLALPLTVFAQRQGAILNGFDQILNKTNILNATLNNIPTDQPLNGDQIFALAVQYNDLYAAVNATNTTVANSGTFGAPQTRRIRNVVRDESLPATRETLANLRAHYDAINQTGLAFFTADLQTNLRDLVAQLSAGLASRGTGPAAGSAGPLAEAFARAFNRTIDLFNRGRVQ